MKISRLALLTIAVLGWTIFGGWTVNGPAANAADRPVKIELNKLEPLKKDACRVYLVLRNGSANAFDALKLDLVVFDPEGIVAKRLAVETAPLPAEKTRLKVFDVNGLACNRAGRLLLNAVMTCSNGSGKQSDCLKMISTSARGKVPFIR